MNVLGFDTCFGALNVALGIGLGAPGARVLTRCQPMATGQAEHLLPVIGKLLDEAGLVPADVDRIAVTCGPGSFTGTRIAIAAARAFRLAQGTPIVTFSSLEAIALHPALADTAPGENLLIAVDAHRGEAYVQLFDGRTRTALGPPRIVAEAQYSDLAGDRPLHVAGTAAGAVAAAITQAGGTARAHDGVVWPAIDAAVVRAVDRPPAETPVEPLYLRPPDAKPQDGKALARVAP